MNLDRRNHYLIQQIPALCSLIGTVAVVITYCLFRKLWKFRHIEIIFYISLSDFVVSCGLILGNAPTGSPACWFQGIVTNSFFLVSSFWNAVAAYQIYLVVLERSSIQNMKLIHLFCWFWPIIVTCLPLSTNSYGNQDTYSAGCYLINRRNSPYWSLFFWEILGFFLWLWIAIACILYFCGRVIYRIRAMQPISEVLHQVIYKLIYYPAVMTSCFIINTALILLSGVGEDISNPKEKEALGILSVALPSAQGFIYAVIFFTQNKVVQQCYIDLYQLGWVATRMDAVKDDGTGNIHVDTDILYPIRPSSCAADFNDRSFSMDSGSVESGNSHQLQLSFGRESRQQALPYPRESRASVLTYAGGMSSNG